MEKSEDELTPSATPGYKPGEKKTLEELAKLDAQDESLRRWKESLGVGAAATAASAKVKVLSMAMEVAGRPDVAIDLSSDTAIEKLKSTTIVVKEGIEYRLKAKFSVSGDVISGLKYIHVVKKMGIRGKSIKIKEKVDKTEEMLGSYGPSPNPYEKKFLPEEAPSGMMARGTYNVRSRFIDDDGTCHLDFQWNLEIKKDWQ